MKKTVSIFAIILVLVVTVALGFYFGQDKGEQRAEEELKPLVDAAYPPPPEVMHSVGGVVKGIYGARIDLEVINPDDYLPHMDGSPREKELRLAVVSSATEIVIIDYTNPQSDGDPMVTLIELSDLKPGDEVKVISEENIRDAKKFDVTRVEVIVY